MTETTIVVSGYDANFVVIVVLTTTSSATSDN